ncbi:hypothetical protein FACS189460_3000 [Deltaproteobacteria bacterium]|nr:hypothetical protein FACS189460_3000 [Deltaproteobacteria bacterium]
MPRQTKSSNAGQFVEMNIILKVAREKLPLLAEALTSVLALQAETALLRESGPALKRDSAPKNVAGPKEPPKKPAPAAKRPARKNLSRKKSPAPQVSTPLRALREKEGLSQKAMAEKVGLRQADISALETGRRALTEKIAQSLAQSFNVEAESLFK